VAEVDAEEEKDERRMFHRISGGGVEVCPARLSLHDGGSLLVDFDGAVVVVEDASCVSRWQGRVGVGCGQARCSPSWEGRWLEEAAGSEVGPGGGSRSASGESPRFGVNGTRTELSVLLPVPRCSKIDAKSVLQSTFRTAPSTRCG
jgi:hypothetical protein